MKLHKIASNMTELRLSEVTVLFSYDTPVAYTTNGKAYRTKTNWSRTTNKQINKWLGRGNGELVDQEDINELVRTAR